MTTASIKTTADLAKESDSRQSGETPEIKTTSSPTVVDAPETKEPESTAIAKPAEPKSEAPESAATTKPEEPKSNTPDNATAKPAEPKSEAPESAATKKSEEPKSNTPDNAADKPAEPKSDAPESAATTKSEEPKSNTPDNAADKPAEPKSDAPESAATTKSEEPKSNTPDNAADKPAEPKSDAPKSAAPKAEEANSSNQIEVKQTPKPAPEPVTAEQITDYSESLSKLSFKNTIKLYELRGHLNRAQKSLTEPELQLRAKVAEILAKIEVLLEQNKVHQEQLNSNTELLLDGLKKYLEDGQSHEALPAWDKIQGNISNTSGKTRADLQEKANAYKTKIDELRDWKIFAATEKKKQMLTQMQHLVDSKMHASDRSKHIANMHKEWKLLGRSNQNEELWKEFKVLSDKAYEPCKEYFKQRKQLMAENLKQRRLLCDQLEKDLAELDTETVNISAVNKLVKGAEESWKKYAPIEQSKIKSLQKRYYDLLNQLRKLRRTEMRDNGKAKQQCIDEAVALELLDDNKKAMNEAKALQQQWKKIGPTSFKEDRKYWDEFRAACDKLFEQRNQEAEKLQSVLKETEDGLRVTLKELEQLETLEEEQFRDSRSEYQTLAQKFSNDLDPRLKQQRSQLTEQFNSIKRKIDMRFKALPDKKFLLLKEKLSSKIALLDKMESELNEITDLESFSDHLKTLDVSAWNELPKVGNESLDSLLVKRWKNLNGLKTPTDFATLVKNETDTLRKQCIELEIRASIETPDSDQATRMEIQLAQLKNAFGKSKPDRQENTKHAKQIEMRSLCFGPINPDTKKPLMRRLATAIARLV
jgi:exonuclease SbcC